MTGLAKGAAPETPPRGRPILLFDVIETLLDTSALEPVFARIFKAPGAARTWLDTLFVYSEALTITGAYADSGAVGVAVATMMAESKGIRLGPDDLAAIRHALGTLPAYPDVAPALKALRYAGYRLTTLSNSPNAASEVQLTAAGIRAPFERLFSVDDRTRRFKPARETYLDVAQELGVRPADLCLISCHAFDVMGAKAAGLSAVFVSRPGNAPFAIGPQADAVIADLRALPAALPQHARN